MMRTRRAWFWTIACISVAAASCHNGPPPTGWIHGSESERWAQAEKHFRGLDMAMVEIGYRYQELHWAGHDGNWPFAAYQLEKIGLSLDRALERRPKRRASAEELFLPVLQDVGESIEFKDPVRFRSSFAEMTAACNACHEAEGVPSFRVARPIQRPSPIRPAP